MNPHYAATMERRRLAFEDAVLAAFAEDIANRRALLNVLHGLAWVDNDIGWSLS